MCSGLFSGAGGLEDGGLTLKDRLYLSVQAGAIIRREGEQNKAIKERG